MARYRTYQEAIAQLTADGETVTVRTSGGQNLTGQIADAGPALLRLTAEQRRDDSHRSPVDSVEHLINPYQIAAITVRVAEA